MKEQTIRYKIIEEKCTLENNTYVGYGVSAVSVESDVICTYHDVSTNKEELECLVEKCNKVGLSLVHLGDVIDDFLI